MDKIIKRNLVFIDLGKYFLACLIPFLHIPWFDYGSIGDYIGQYPARLGVPFFFVCSGYFLQKKIDKHEADAKQIFKHQLIRVLQLFLIWETIYAPIQIYMNTSKSGLSVSTILQWLQTTIMACESCLWYLPALAIGIALLWLFQKINIRISILACCSLYFFGTMFNSYEPIMPSNQVVETYFNIFLTTRNGIFCGFPLVFLGSYIAKKQCKSAHIALVILFIGVLFAEIYFVRSIVPNETDTSMYFSIPFVMYFLFTYLVFLSNKLATSKRYEKLSAIALKLRNSSIAIYVMQTGIIYSSMLIMMHFNIENPWIVYALVIIISTAFSMLTSKNKYLSKLF